MNVYKVVGTRSAPEKRIIDCLNDNLWIGYITKGGNVAILLNTGRTDELTYGFISNNSPPAFCGSTRETAFYKALHGGREVFAARTLTDLEKCPCPRSTCSIA